MDKLPQRFKFWLGAIGKMSYPMNLIDIGTMFSQEINNSEHTVPIQSTGTYDKFGIELYFDDILQDENGSRAVLVWNQDCLGLASGARGAIGNYHTIYRVSTSELKTYQRVGNIYENPELMQVCIFTKGMVFYSVHLKDCGKYEIPITVIAVNPKTNELIVSYAKVESESWDLELCEYGIQNGDYYF